MGFGAPELILVLLLVLVLFGYKRLPDASRSFGRSLRIFKGEMRGMKEDHQATPGPVPDRSVPALDVPWRTSAAGINGAAASGGRVAAHAVPDDRETARSAGVGGTGETA